MTTRMVRAMAAMAGLAWLVVGAVEVRSAFVDDGDEWELAYMIFSAALLLAATVTVALVAGVTEANNHRWLRAAGLAIAGVGCLSAIVAWALPLWMTLLGGGLAVVAFASTPPQRRGIATLAGAQLMGMAVLIGAIEGQVGRRDEHGDYPAATGIALTVTAVLVIVALFQLARSFQSGGVVARAGKPVPEPV